MGTAIGWITDVPIDIAPLKARDLALFDQHFARHRAESGRGDRHFMPFAPDDHEGPKGLDARLFQLPLDAPGWQRWWVAWLDNARIIGHVDLKGEFLKTALHRCELGVGIERTHRHQGLGRRLMTTAIEFARQAPSLDWIDLRVFAHNDNARALYMDLGFVEVATLTDRFRIEGTSLDDVMMALDVRV